MATELIDVKNIVKHLMHEDDDDFVDRLSRKYTVILLIVFDIVIVTFYLITNRTYLEFECHINFFVQH